MCVCLCRPNSRNDTLGNRVKHFQFKKKRSRCYHLPAKTFDTFVSIFLQNHIYFFTWALTLLRLSNEE